MSTPQKFVEVLKKCESAEGAGTKKIIQAALAELDEAGRTLMRYAMDPYKVFGIRKFEAQESFADVDPDITALIKVLDDLDARKITGDMARMEWSKTLHSFTEETAAYIERIIDKDPRAGFSADTFNKVWPNDKIPTFEVMLADKCNTTEEFEKHVNFPAWSAFKLDGNRSIAIVRVVNGEFTVEYRARSGKISEHLNGLFDEDFFSMRKILGYDFVADGEAFASNFTETMNAKKSGNDEAKANMRFHLFFFMPYTDWVAQNTTITMEQNVKQCNEVLASLAEIRPLTEAKVVSEIGKIVHSYAEMMAHCDEAIDIHGEEGLIVKDLNSTYTWDRSYAWCKIKRFFDADLQVLGFYSGRPKSRLENTLGGVIAAGYLEDGTLVLTCVGSGFSDADRDEIWNNKEKYLGQTFVCKYQEVSKAKGKDINSLRFGTFEHFRDDKPIEFKEEDYQVLHPQIKKLADSRVK